jgi:hypothetical protein
MSPGSSATGAWKLCVLTQHRSALETQVQDWGSLCTPRVSIHLVPGAQI